MAGFSNTVKTVYMAAYYMAEPPTWRVISRDISIFESEYYDRVYGGTANIAAILAGQTSTI